MSKRIFLAGLAVLTIAFSASCTKKKEGKTIWIYSSMYKNVIADMEPLLKAKFPAVEFQWYQSGSENVAARVNAELSSNRSQADLILTSDPFWYLELKKGGHLLKTESPVVEKVAKEFRDPDGMFSVVRMCVGVIAYNSSAIPQNEAPKSWADLVQSKWTKKVSIGSPLESGTAVTLVSQLVRKQGWEYFEKFKKNDLLSAGGNSAVIQRIETKERPIGILLLENALEAKQKGSPIEIVYPTEGVILVPSPIAVMAKTKEPELATQVFNYFFSEDMQNAIMKGRMHSPILTQTGPKDALPFEKIRKTSFEWNPSVLESLYQDKEATKKKFSDIILN